MKYLKYYPPVLQEVLEIKILSGVMDAAIDKLKSSIDKLNKELFVLTAEDIGLSKWEKSLNIKKGLNESIELRRFRIIAKLNGDNSGLKSKLNLLIGEGNYELKVYPNECMIELAIHSTANYIDIQAINELLDKVIPANLNYGNTVEYEQRNILYTATSINTAMVYTITPDINKKYSINNNISTATVINTATTVAASE